MFNPLEMLRLSRRFKTVPVISLDEFSEFFTAGSRDVDLETLWNALHLHAILRDGDETEPLLFFFLVLDESKGKMKGWELKRNSAGNLDLVST